MQSIAAIVADLMVKLEQDCGIFLPHTCPMGRMNTQKRVFMSHITNLAEKKGKSFIDAAFIIMMILSAAMTYYFYMAWNSPRSAPPEMSGSVLQNYHVDSCFFGKRDISVVGWAFLPGNWKILNRIYAEKKSGSMVELMSSFQPRRDVGEAFRVGGLYDKSGFIATRHDLSSKEDFTGNIIIISVDEKGVGHAAKYNCK